MLPTRARLAALLLCASCETHTIAVFAPVASVAPRTTVEASIAPGRVTQYPPGTRLASLHLAPTDTVVVLAENGDIVGDVRVRRRSNYTSLLVLGYFVSITGSAGGLLLGTLLTASEKNLVPLFAGTLTAAGSLTVGGTLIAAGKNGTLEQKHETAEPTAQRSRITFISWR